MTNTEYDTTTGPAGANALSAEEQLERATEAKLYGLFKTFFRTAEEDRRWNVWTDVPWEDAPLSPAPALVDAVLDSYREDLFLPDYSARTLHLLRASRGRAWFLTRWSYEEGKHMLGLNEWLMRTKAYGDVEIRELTEAHLQAYRWEPLYTDSIAIFADMLLWEMREIERYGALHSLALESGDPALAKLAGHIVDDENAHREFFQAALAISANAYPDKVSDAIARVAAAQEFPGGESALRALLAVATA